MKLALKSGEICIKLLNYSLNSINSDSVNKAENVFFKKDPTKMNWPDLVISIQNKIKSYLKVASLCLGDFFSINWMT